MTRARDLAAGTFELATGGVLKLETSDTTVTDGSVLGKIEFKAPDEASGTDAILVGAAIEAVAEGTFAADNNATELVFKTGASAAADAKMTLTSGGHLLVGKTGADNTSAGTTIYSTLGFSSVRSGGVVGILNRLSNDGDILTFRKDGTTVGSVGVISSNNLIIANPSTNHSGVVFGTNTILPAVEDDYADGLVDFGNSSERWRDIYLSGGVFLGGTGAANKLHDYEEGTWTPTLAAGTVSVNNTSTYTKIGRLVTCQVDITYPSQTNANDADVFGLPFTSTNNVAESGGAVFSNFNTSNNLVGFTAKNNTRFRLQNGAGTSITLTNMSGKVLRATITYITDA